MAVLSAALITGGGLVESGVASGAASGGPPVKGAALFDQVMTSIARNYVEPVSTDSLYRKAVDGMLGQLRDPHTVFLDAKRLARLNETTSGNYGGLGVQIDVRDGWITIIAPLPGSPAERAGIQTGDRIVEVNARSTRGWTQDEATKALRGNAGSVVNILVERPGVDERIPFRLARRNIHARAVQRVATLRPGIGYLDVNVYSDSTANEVAQGVDSLVRAGAKAVLLDLRGNPGGLLDQGVSVADLFLDQGREIVSMRGRTRDVSRTFTDHAAQRWPKLAVVVLVNAGSASAAEIVAGALQDHDRAVLVGELTYGKGSAQTVFPVAPNGALKLTTALWYTPVGRCIIKRPAVEDGDVG
jgi:carboxyl-terminal processing protease